MSTIHVPKRTLDDTRDMCPPGGYPRPELTGLTLHLVGRAPVVRAPRTHLEIKKRRPQPETAPAEIYDWSKE